MQIGDRVKVKLHAPFQGATGMIYSTYNHPVLKTVYRVRFDEPESGGVGTVKAYDYGEFQLIKL